MNVFQENKFVSFLMIGLIELTTYGVSYFCLNRFNTEFNKIIPLHKKTYVTMNLVKSFFLGILSILFFYHYLNNTLFEYTVLYNLGSIYILLDLIALFVVHKMQLNTKIHHIIVQILFVISYLYEFSASTYVVQGIIIYTIFSSVAFMVNAFLAFRIFITNKWLVTFAQISMGIYIISCCFNWIYQIYILHHLNVIVGLVYFTLLILIIYDDITLIKYLYNFSKAQ